RRCDTALRSERAQVPVQTGRGVSASWRRIQTYRFRVACECATTSARRGSARLQDRYRRKLRGPSVSSWAFAKKTMTMRGGYALAVVPLRDGVRFHRGEYQPTLTGAEPCRAGRGPWHRCPSARRARLFRPWRASDG